MKTRHFQTGKQSKNSAGAELGLDGVRITNFENNEPASDVYNGVVLKNDGVVRINNSEINAGTTSDVKYDKTVYGGVLYNAGEMSINNTAFTNNALNVGAVSIFGGVIYNSGDQTITDSIFTGNILEGTYGQYGFLYNTNGKMTISGSVFSNNKSEASTGSTSTSGGIIYNYRGSLEINESAFSDNVFSKLSISGGILYSFTGSLDITNSSFMNNNTVSASTLAGGVIDFRNSSSSDKTELRVTNSLFAGNMATADTNLNGGVVYLSFGKATFIDSSFINNAAIAQNAKGAAIHTGVGELTVLSQNKDVIFEGNYTAVSTDAEKVSNAIYSLNQNMTFNAVSKNIIFNDRIIASGNIFINKSDDIDYNGTIELNEDMSGVTGNVNIYNGTVRLGEDRINTYGQNVTPKFFNATGLNLAGGKIDLRNNKIDTVSVESFAGTNGEVVFDVDLETGENDKINVTDAASTSSSININSLNILKDTTDAAKTITLSDKIALVLGADYTYTNANRYQLSTPEKVSLN